VQRLETLGDAFLKYAVCVSLYLQHPQHTEGQMSVAKHATVSNASLCAHAQYFPAAAPGGLRSFLRTRPLRCGRALVSVPGSWECTLELLSESGM
jgi:dsRNA-specific ribonuclease